MKQLFLFLMLLSAHCIKAQETSALTFDVGSFTISVLSEGQQQGRANILIGATDEMMKEYIPNGTYPNSVNAFLVAIPGKTILIDAAFGKKLFDNLQSLGKTPNDIDVILLTHMHGDHIGGLLRDGKRSFPAAILYIPQPEHDYWMSDEMMHSLPENRRGGFIKAREVINAYKDKLHLFTPGEAGGAAHELFPGIHSIAAYGHTPGHTGYLLQSEESKLFIWGDLTHAMAIQIPCPQVAVTYDNDPAKAIETRQRLFKYVTDNKIRIAGMHIEFPGLADISKAAGGYIFDLLCDCEGR